jgi:hypothetical protein
LHSTNPWDYVSNDLLCDTSAYVWEVDNGYGDDNNFYVITQEYDKNGPVTNPKNGILFAKSVTLPPKSVYPALL